MGRDLFKQDDDFRALINEASQQAGEDLELICLRGPAKKLVRPSLLQPLLVAVSLGYLRHVIRKNIIPDFVLGHSLGEITALVAAGIIDDRLAISIATKRGQLMDEAATVCEGGMMAILAVAPDKIQGIIDDLGLDNQIVIANYNTLDQTVLSGKRSAFDQLVAEIHKAGGKCKKLNVAGPWHSPYMQNAYEQFRIWVEPLTFQSPQMPVILDGTGQAESDPIVIKQAITSSLINPVQFRKCMEYCHAQSVKTFLEIGPGRVLSGLVRANGFEDTTRIYKVNNYRGVELVASELSSQPQSA